MWPALPPSNFSCHSPLSNDASNERNQGRLKQLLPYGSAGGYVVSKALSINPNFSFLNRISPLLNQVVTQYCPHEARWILTFWMAVRRDNHYTKEVITYRIKMNMYI